MARSRSGTRGRRGPRKPPRRDNAFTSPVQVVDPRERGAIELPGTITVKELADLLAVNVADVIRELIKSGIFATINQLIDRDTASLVASELGYEVAETVAASTNGDRPRWRDRRHRARGHQGGPLRGGRPEEAPAARPDRHRHGPRRPRQDQPARRAPLDRGRGRRARWHHPAHRRIRGRPRRQARRLPRHAGSRGVHRDACPRSPRHGHRDHRGRRRRRGHAPDARGDQPRQGGQGADHHRAQQDRQAGRRPDPGQDRADRGGHRHRGVRRRRAARPGLGQEPRQGLDELIEMVLLVADLQELKANPDRARDRHDRRGADGQEPRRRRDRAGPDRHAQRRRHHRRRRDVRSRPGARERPRQARQAGRTRQRCRRARPVGGPGGRRHPARRGR